MKRLLTLFFAVILLSNSSIAVTAAEKKAVLLSDFRGVNLLDAFYTYDKENNNFVFVPISKTDYFSLSHDNKIIYKKVKSAQSLLEKAQSPLFKVNEVKYRQKALKKNPDLLPAAYELSQIYKKREQYSTALYYAEKVKKKDRKNRYPEISSEVAELYKLINCEEKKPVQNKKR